MQSQVGGLEMQLEAEKNKGQRRIIELSSELEILRGNGPNVSTKSEETQTEILTKENSCQSDISISHVGAQTELKEGADFSIQTDIVDIKFLKGCLLHKVNHFLEILKNKFIMVEVLLRTIEFTILFRKEIWNPLPKQLKRIRLKFSSLSHRLPKKKLRLRKIETRNPNYFKKSVH